MATTTEDQAPHLTDDRLLVWGVRPPVSTGDKLQGLVEGKHLEERDYKRVVEEAYRHQFW